MFALGKLLDGDISFC